MRLASPAVLRQLRVFCVCARSLSFKGAAATLFLTPSAVSHQIRELEEHLGLKLFDRRTRALELTLDGRQLLEDVEPLFASINDAVARISRRRERRVLRLALPPFFETEVFIPRLAGFYAAQPDIDIQVSSQDPRPVEHPVDADVSVLLLEGPPAGLVAHELFALRLVAAFAPAVGARALRLGANLFSESALIVHSTRRDAWERWAQENNLNPPEPRKVIELDSMHSVVRAAEQGLGVALVPQVAAAAWFASGSIERFSADELETGESYYLTCRPDDAPRREVEAFKNWAIAEFGAPSSRTPG
jgi:LysR family transcriptional regulator, glycine cleavage system transcriptional activator